MIRVSSDVNIYEIHGEKTVYGNKLLHVKSHWNSDKMVVLTIDDQTITVAVSDLQQAIENAVNANRFG